MAEGAPSSWQTAPRMDRPPSCYCADLAGRPSDNRLRGCLRPVRRWKTRRGGLGGQLALFQNWPTTATCDGWSKNRDWRGTDEKLRPANPHGYWLTAVRQSLLVAEPDRSHGDRLGARDEALHREVLVDGMRAVEPARAERDTRHSSETREGRAVVPGCPPRLCAAAGRRRSPLRGAPRRSAPRRSSADGTSGARSIDGGFSASQGSLGRALHALRDLALYSAPPALRVGEGGQVADVVRDAARRGIAHRPLASRPDRRCRRRGRLGRDHIDMSVEEQAPSTSRATEGCSELTSALELEPFRSELRARHLLRSRLPEVALCPASARRSARYSCNARSSRGGS